LHGCPEALIVFQQAQCGILDQALGVGPFVISDPRKLSFLFGSEMYFHGLQGRDSRGLCQ